MTAETPVRGKRIQLDALTGVRGLLSLTVFLGHAGMEPVYRHKEINTAIIYSMVGFGEAAVSFFFMLSGFVLVWASRPGDTAATFWRRRIAKIFPNHLVTWAVGLVLMIVTGEFVNLWNVLPSLALLQVWVPNEAVLSGTNGPSWSLSCELFFYALFPLLLARARRIPDERLWRWLGGTVAVMAGFTLLVGLFVPSQPQALGLPVSIFQFYILIFIPPVRLLDFVLGMLIARIIISGRWPQYSWGYVTAALVVGYAVAVALPAPLGFVVPLTFFNVLALGKAASIDISGGTSFFHRPSMVWLGNVSFGMYLVHWLVLHYGRVLIGGETPNQWSTPAATAFLVGALVVSLSLGELLRRYVENPAMKRWGRAKRPAPALTPAPAQAGTAVPAP